MLFILKTLSFNDFVLYHLIILLYCFRGKYDIFVENKLVGNYDNRGSFGELALMYNMPRAATIVATTDGSLWAMVSYYKYIDFIFTEDPLTRKYF